MVESEPIPEYDAIVLAGGRGSRLGGVDKAGLHLGGRSLLDRALAAVAGAGQRVVVGPVPPEAAAVAGVVVTCESPPGGGPVAGLEAGLAYVGAPLVAVLACDMPLVDRATVDVLAGAVGDADGALLVDEGGRRQPLAAVYAREALQQGLDALDETRGAAMMRVATLMRLVEIRGRPGQTADCDTWADVAHLHEYLEDA